MGHANVPVIIGTGQLVDREATVSAHQEPLAMLEQVARLAAADAGAPQALAALDTVALVGIAGWHPQNPANLVATALGAAPQTELTTGTGGQVGVTLLNEVASRIADGRSELALVAGCNNLKVLMKAIADGVKLDWQRGGAGSAEMVGGEQPGESELERRYGMRQPPDIYPLFENARRARLGLSLDAHATSMGQLFTRFTEVAAANPYAWFPTARSADELITPTAANRMISFPYPKYLNAVLNTEQAAGLIVCSAEKARALGISEDRWTYWWGGAHSQETAWWASERPDFATCPSMLDTHTSAMANAGVTADDLSRFDFYSCFPVAVEVACDLLGLALDDPRGFTVTGGLPYAGGPASAYTLHSLATMAATLREEGGKGLVTGNGWYLTKHSAAVLSSTPRPDDGFANTLLPEKPSAALETAPRPVIEQATGDATVQTYTVGYQRDGTPDRGIVLGMTDAGERFLANTPADAGFLADFVAEERVGTRGKVQRVDGMSEFVPS